MIQYLGIALIGIGTSVLFLTDKENNETISDDSRDSHGGNSGRELHAPEKRSGTRRLKKKKPVPKNQPRTIKEKDHGQIDPQRGEIRPSRSRNDCSSEPHTAERDRFTESVNEPEQNEETNDEKDVKENEFQNSDESIQLHDGDNVSTEPSGGKSPDGA